MGTEQVENDEKVRLPEESGGSGVGSGDFRRLWFALSISQLGTAAASAALPLVAVKVLGLGILGVSVVSLATAATVLCVALPIGSWVEFRRKRLSMMQADIFRSLFALGLAVFLWFGRANVATLVVVAAATAVGGIAYNSASQAYLPFLVGKAGLVEANGRLQSSVWMSMAVGPFLGAGLVALVSPAWVFVLDGLTFLGSAALIWRIRKADSAIGTRTEGSPWQAAFEGFRWIRSSPFMWRQLVSWFLFAGASAALTPLLSVWYLRDLSFSGRNYALVLAVGSIGGVIGSLLVGRLARRLGRLRLLGLTNLLRAPWVFGYALVPYLPLGVAWSCFFFFALLLVASMFNASLTATRQELAPPDVISRVASSWFLAASLAQPLMICVVALLAQVWGTQIGLLASGAVVTAAVVVARPIATTSLRG
ncbi:MFS transporter [Arsenicicoccus sp. UBA7492]|uniref:MFS transporter n=1 Tax=Arsenicicoccus sp. UBA7492 TaxID=1946057 RepID=UPI00257D191D|nr:MFS transporter [Arsenicicoccus sp. UBA7492]